MTAMRLSDWHKLELDAEILREPVPASDHLVLWQPIRWESQERVWERISTLAHALVIASHGIGSLPAQSFLARQQPRRWLGWLFFSARKSSKGQVWTLPNGKVVEQFGERQTDFLLVWAEEAYSPLSEAQLRERWPHARRLQRLGTNLFLVAGLVPPNPTAEAEIPGQGPLSEDVYF